MPEPSDLFFSILFGIVGMAYMAYGRKNDFYFMLAGMCLIAISFFTFDFVTYICIAVGLIIAPFILTKIIK